MTGLNAHGFGLAWFEQKRDAGGAISFVRHMIIDDYSTRNAGDVTMSEMHAAAVADVDGDGIPDFITGKRVFSHQESYVDPDPHGLPALYWFRTVRNPNAPGGAEFVPELIHNRSGVGAQFTAVDLEQGRPGGHRHGDQSRHLHLLRDALATSARNRSGRRTVGS